MKKIVNLIAILCLLIGFVLLFKPYGKYFQREYASRIDIKEFDAAAEALKSTDSDKAAEILSDMTAYNESVYENGQTELFTNSDAELPFHQTIYTFFPSRMIGYVQIDKIGVKMPIFYGINDNNLSRGAAVMEGSSLPVGGENTNCVLAAHRLPGMLGEVEKLEEGDIITLNNFQDTLYYRVVKIIVIDPYDKEKVMIRPEKDMLTLLTCHPYWVNSHRMIVYSERVYLDGEEDSENIFPEKDPEYTDTINTDSKVLESAPSSNTSQTVSEQNNENISAAVEESVDTEYQTSSMSADYLPDGEPYEPSEPTIRNEHIVRMMGIAVTVFFLLLIIVTLFRGKR